MDAQKAIKQLRLLKKYGKNLRLAAERWHKPWQSLISTALSARTMDEKTIHVCNILFKRYPEAKDLASARLKDVQRIIMPVNYYKTKSRHIVACAKILVEKYRGVPPHDFEKLVELPGVGRKTANVFLSEMGKSTIGVDTHVSHISQRLGWTKNKKPEKIEADIKRLFPRKYWRRINPIVVRFGRSYRGKKKEEILNGLRRIS